VQKIPLSGIHGRGKYALVDDDVYYKIRHLEWVLRMEGGQPRTVAAWTDVNGKRTYLKLHRYVMDCYDAKVFVDHRDGNVLDNRRHNLRLATRQQNNQNRAAHKGAKSPYKGVVWDNPKRKWRAQINLEGRRKFLGYFESEGDAAHNYDWWAIQVHGEFAKLNFPAYNYATFTPKVNR
jgi:hypothetical protein